jgi:pimeloyl-ACP methyl ester carboxylesterase
MGTNVVIALAAERPDLARRVVLMAPTLQPPFRTFAVAAATLLRTALREPPSAFVIAFTDYVLRCGLPYLLRQTPHLLADRPEELLASLDVDVLVVCGDRDPIVDPAWGRELAGLGRRAGFLEVRGAHVVMHTDPVRIARHLMEFAA